VCDVSHDDVGRLQGGLALYRDDFVDGFYDEWVINERYRFESLFSEGRIRLALTGKSVFVLEHDQVSTDSGTGTKRVVLQTRRARVSQTLKKERTRW
jgi:hypothetical protein